MTININQWLFSKEQQRTFLEQWLTCDEYGMNTLQFCQQLVRFGDSQSQSIGRAGLVALENGTVIPALEGWLPALVINSIDVAEQAGNRQLGLKAALAQLEGGQNVILRLAGVIAVPFFALIGAGSLGVFVSGEILKSVSSAGVGIGNTINQAVAIYGPLAVMAFSASMVAVAVSFGLWRGELRTHTNNWPLYKQYRLSQAHALLTSLGNLSKCGMKLDDALGAVSASGATRYLQSHIAQMRQRIDEEGEKNLGKIMNTGLLLPFERANLEVLGETGDNAKLLLKSGSNHEKALKKQMGFISAVLPKLTVVLAILLLLGLLGSAMSQLMDMMNQL